MKVLKLNKEYKMQNLWIKNLIISGFLLIITSACVMTPTGEIIAPPVGVNATVDLTPHYVFRSRSNVTISIGPDYTISDAFILADNHCSSYGYFAVPVRDWDFRYDSVRRLEYYCRRTSTYLPPVIITSPRSRYYGRPYRLYNNPYPRYHHRDRHHHDNRYNRPSGGWWSRNQNDNNRRVAPTPPAHTPRATTPQSPWSYNPRKDDNDHRPSYDNRDRDRDRDRGSSGWWGRNNRSTSSGNNSSSSSKPSSSSSGSYSSPAASSTSSSSSSSAAPGWWGKNKK